MAFKKTFPTRFPNLNFTYVRIDRIDFIDELAKGARFQLRLYPDAASATNSEAHEPFANFIVNGDAFTAYFSRAILASCGKSVHAQAYQCIKDYEAAVAAFALIRAHKAGAPNPPPVLTPAQTALVDGRTGLQVARSGYNLTGATDA